MPRPEPYNPSPEEIEKAKAEILKERETLTSDVYKKPRRRRRRSKNQVNNPITESESVRYQLQKYYKPKKTNLDRSKCPEPQEPSNKSVKD